jgi:Tfp pilus assembly PilM family ATPase/Tfp pilus assembly protein PilN
MWKKSKDTVCISITENEIKAVAVKGAGTGARITQAVVSPIDKEKSDDLSKTVASALKPLKVKGANVCFIAPPTSVTTKNIEIPSTNVDEIRSIVSLQAGRHTPFARDEIQIGYVNIGVHKNNYTKVLLVIVNKNALKSQITTLSKAGFKVSKVYFAPESVADFYATAMGLKGQEETVGVVDVGQQTTEFILISNGVVATSRNIPVGKQALADEGESAQSRLIEEITKTVESSQTEEIIATPKKYVLSSDDPHMRTLQTGLHEKVQTEIEIVPFIDKVGATKSVIKKMATDYATHSFLDVTAPAIYGDDKSIDLLPDEIHMQEMISSQGKEVFKIAILTFFLFVVVASLLSAKLFYKSQVLEKYVDKYEENKDQVDTLEDISERTQIVKQFLDNRMTSLQIIEHLYRDIPKEIYLTNLIIDGEKTIRMEGISDIGSLIHKLVTQLARSEYFEEVDLIATNSRKDRGKDVHAFEIVIQLEKDEESDESEEAEDNPDNTGTEE